MNSRKDGSQNKNLNFQHLNCILSEIEFWNQCDLSYAGSTTLEDHAFLTAIS